MSLHLEFEPHSWYMGFAIQLEEENVQRGNPEWQEYVTVNHWHAYTDNGNTYQVDEVTGDTLADLKFAIREYWLKQAGGNLNKVPAYLVKPLALHQVRTRIPF